MTAPLTIQLSLGRKARERIQSWRGDSCNRSDRERRLEARIRELIGAALPPGQSVEKVDLRPGNARDRHLVVAVAGAQDKEALCALITETLAGLPAYRYRLLFGSEIGVPLLADDAECS